MPINVSDSHSTIPQRRPGLVISLDFELIWGVRDHSTRDACGANVLGGREAVPRMLDMFEKHGVHATWATVGFLFAEGLEELKQYLPEEALRPVYDHRAFSNYQYLEEVGDTEKSDPFAFAPSLIDQIAKTPGQEIATHTMSHYYCLESGPTDAAFEADIAAAKAIAKARGIDLCSIVFPRSQYAERHLEICERQAITVYRGNSRGAAYRPGPGTSQGVLRRARRLADAYIGLSGAQVHDWPEDAAPTNVPASAFLRPCAGPLRKFHPLHLRQVMKQMDLAAQEAKAFHLWWHPENFGVNLEENLDGLDRLLGHFAQLRDSHGMQSLTMKEAA